MSYHPEELSVSTITRDLFYDKEGIFDILKGKTVLDVGCGTGFFTGLMTKKAKKTVGIDISYSNIKIASHLNENDVNFLTADAHLPPFKNKVFDVVFLDCTLEHFNEPEKVLEQVKRVSKDRSLVILTVNIKPKATYIFYQLVHLFDFIFEKGHPELHKMSKFSDATCPTGDYIDIEKLVEFMGEDFTLVKKEKYSGLISNLAFVATGILEKIERVLFHKELQGANIGDHFQRLESPTIKIYRRQFLPVLRKLSNPYILTFDANYATLVFERK